MKSYFDKSNKLLFGRRCPQHWRQKLNTAYVCIYVTIYRAPHSSGSQPVVRGPPVVCGPVPGGPRARPKPVDQEIFASKVSKGKKVIKKFCGRNETDIEIILK